MSDLKIALLPNRGVLKVTGKDAQKFLQGIITADMDQLGAEGTGLHTGLLSPQGKILFDFFVVPADGGYLIETDKGHVAELLKRLTMYKLRADVTITDASADYTVAAVWGSNPCEAAGSLDCICFNDPRQGDLGVRLLMTLTNDSALKKLDADAASEPSYDARRIALGIPEAGKDFPLGDTFPHEALYDQLGSVSFNKGCYVGQEVVSRMQHRSTVRKRVVPITGDKALPPGGSDITAGIVAIGSLGTVCENRGLAMLRLDRAAETLAKGEKLSAGDAQIEIALPQWATFKFPPEADAKA